MSKQMKKIMRFVVVGGTAFVIDFGVLWLMTEALHVNYLISNCTAFIVSVIYNYILSILWVFDVKQNQNKAVELFVFVLLSAIGLGLNQLIMWVAVDKIGAHYLFSKVVATGIVMVYNYVTRKRFLEN